MAGLLEHYAGPNPANPSYLPFITQEDQNGELGTWARPEWLRGRCGYCQRPVGLVDGFVELLSDYDTSIGYPDEARGVRAILTHGSCGPGVGYWIDLPRLFWDGLDGARGWGWHLATKVWYHEGLRPYLEAGIALAQSLQPRPEPETVKNPVKPFRPRSSGNPRSISVSLRAFIMERDSFTCRRCGRKAPDVPLAVDHIVPVAKGGAAEETNLQTLCRDCNAGKSDRDPHSHDHLPPRLVP